MGLAAYSGGSTWQVYAVIFCDYMTLSLINLLRICCEFVACVMCVDWASGASNFLLISTNMDQSVTYYIGGVTESGTKPIWC